MVHLLQDNEKQKDPRLPGFADCHLYIYPLSSSILTLAQQSWNKASMIQVKGHRASQKHCKKRSWPSLNPVFLTLEFWSSSVSSSCPDVILSLSL